MSNNNSSDVSQSQAELEKKLFSMLWGHYVSACLRTAADLNLADHLKEDKHTASELAKKVFCHGPSLHRLMRALATVGIFHLENNQFSLTPLGSLLRTDVAGSQRGLVIEMCDYFSAWGELTNIIKTGEVGVDNIYNTLLSDDERAAHLYDAMDKFHYHNPAPMLGCYDFSGVKVVADIGGGSGSQLIAILKHHQHLKGVLFDLPNTAKKSEENINRSGLAGRCQIIGGSFFDAVPTGADLYILRHVIHNWDDKDTVRILSNIAQILPKDGRVLIIETLVGSGREEESFAVWWDMAMFVAENGAERTKEEYVTLLEQSGLKFMSLIPTSSDVSIVEASLMEK